MVTRIQLGNLVSNNGKPTLVGSQTGLDTKAIIDALTEAKRAPAVRLEKSNEKITAQTEALNSLKSLVTRFKSAADVLRSPPGVGNAAQNIFQYRTAVASAGGGNIASNYVSVSAQPGAEIQSFNITNIQQLARETRQETNVFSLPDTTAASVVAALPTAGQFTAGSFTLRNLTGGAAVAVTLNTGDSLNTVATRFNEVSDRTGIRANIIKVASGSPNNDYKIIFTATKTGTTTGFDLNNPSTVISDPSNVLAGLVPPPVQAAQNARFFIDGIQIDRETNTVDDVFSGLTFTLKQTNAAAFSINTVVQPDTAIVKNAIVALADVYNEFRIFNAKQTEVGENGLPTEDAVLAGSNALRSIVANLTSETSRVVAGITGGNPARLSDIGISFKDFEGDEDTPFTRNVISVDDVKLESALGSNFNGVRGLFEFQLKSDNASLAIFKRTNDLNANSFTLNINQSGSTYTATVPGIASPVVLDGTPFSVGTGVTLKGRAGTVLEGLELIFASGANATVNVTATQGIGDRLFNGIDDILDETDGTLSNALNQLEKQIERNDTEITRVDEQIVSYRQQIEAQYASLEAALARANNLLALLNAQSGARESA
jgi:flagellar hook-associated protein 2